MSSFINTLVHILRRLAFSKVTCPLITFAGVHITKLHLYMSTAGGITLLDYKDGHHMYGTLVLILALIDMTDD